MCRLALLLYLTVMVYHYVYRLWRCYSACVQYFISISFPFLQVQKIDIGYAKTAKKMDVKKLKSAMWGLLTANGQGNKVCSKARLPCFSTLTASNAFFDFIWVAKYFQF